MRGKKFVTAAVIVCGLILGFVDAPGSAGGDQRERTERC